MKTGVALLVCLLLGGCSSKNTKDKNPQTNVIANTTQGGLHLPSGLKVWTEKGNNRHPWISQDGRSLFFVSSDRGHANFQIYNLDLKSGNIKRITFQNGDCLQGSIVPGSPNIVYSSSTDELKEKAFMDTWAANYLNPNHQQTDGADKPTELYESRPDGSQIRRLTKSPGFDGDVTVHKNGRTAVFSSRRSGHSQLYKLHLSLTAVEPLFQGPFEDQEPQFSPDGKQLAWVRREKKTDGTLGTAQIYISNWPKGTPEKITSVDSNHVSPSWSPDGKSLVFSSDRRASGQFDVYTWNKEKNCLLRHTDSSQNLDPIFHSDGQFIYFANSRSGTFHIYSLSITPPAASSVESSPCLTPAL